MTGDQDMRAIRLFLVTGLLINLLCCGTNRATPAAAGSFDLAPQLSAYLNQPFSAANSASLQRISIAEYYQALLTSTTDDSVTVGQEVVGRAHSLIANAGPLFAILQARYGSVGELLANSSRSSQSLVDVTSGLADLAKAYSEVPGPASEAARQNDTAGFSVAMRNFAALETLAGTFGTHSQGGLALVNPTTSPQGSAPSCQSGGTMYLVHYKPPANFGVGHSATYFEGNAALGIESFFQNYPGTGVQFSPPPVEEVAYNPGKPIDPNDIEIYQVGEVPADKARALVDKLQIPPDPYTADTVTGSNYHLLLSNCAQRSLSILKEAGFNVPSVVFTPTQLYDSVVRHN